MIMKQAELALLKRGRRWFTLPRHPGWQPGKVVRLRTSGRDEGFVVTITDVLEDAGAWKISFTPGDTREEELYIAAGHPDYTTDSFRAMRGEPQPFPEDASEKKNRTAWLLLALKHEPQTPKRRSQGIRESHTARERVFYEAGTPEAVRIVRLFRGGGQRQ